MPLHLTTNWCRILRKNKLNSSSAPGRYDLSSWRVRQVVGSWRKCSLAYCVLREIRRQTQSNPTEERGGYRKELVQLVDVDGVRECVALVSHPLFHFLQFEQTHLGFKLRPAHDIVDLWERLKK